ncbi:carboxymuconolactone decarboxylase family protein [Streptomyces sp. MBT84]|uniref:carboxymuconolactone decarboxylase family protein n=1 Tax=Streptomyces sp. MBT84 TaxID=1488414 RepID=UPI001C6E3635|nr:carboxymuconolactone decarboxylase family protein [Streptomyces sp. MBT84]
MTGASRAPRHTGVPAPPDVRAPYAAQGDNRPVRNARTAESNRSGFSQNIKEALHAGESATRLHLVAAWREATVFTEAERAALELTEQGTRIADAAGGVTDEAWQGAAKHYDEEQLAALVCAIPLSNAYNRGNVIVRQPAGDHQPGRFA